MALSFNNYTKETSWNDGLYDVDQIILNTGRVRHIGTVNYKRQKHMFFLSQRVIDFISDNERVAESADGLWGLMDEMGYVAAYPHKEKPGYTAYKLVLRGVFAAKGEDDETVAEEIQRIKEFFQQRAWNRGVRGGVDFELHIDRGASFETYLKRQAKDPSP